MRSVLAIAASIVLSSLLASTALARQNQVVPAGQAFPVPGSGGVVVDNQDNDPDTPGVQGPPVRVSWEPGPPVTDIEVEV